MNRNRLGRAVGPPIRGAARSVGASARLGGHEAHVGRVIDEQAAALHAATGGMLGDTPIVGVQPRRRVVHHTINQRTGESSTGLFGQAGRERDDLVASDARPDLRMPQRQMDPRQVRSMLHAQQVRQQQQQRAQAAQEEAEAIRRSLETHAAEDVRRTLVEGLAKRRKQIENDDEDDAGPADDDPRNPWE